jgi:hypothetical protein
MLEQARLENPDQQVVSEDDGSVWRSIGRGLTYNSDVAAKQEAAQKAAGIGSPAISAPGPGGRARPNVPETAGLPAALPKVPTGGAGAGASASAASSTGIGQPYSGKIDYNVDAEEAKISKLNEAEIAARRQGFEADEAAFERDIAARGLAGEGREKRAKEGLEALAGEKDAAKANAFVQAGLAILSADPAKGGWAAIGAGGGAGFQAYKGDLKDLSAKREKLLGTLDELEDVRRAESVADARERRGLISRRNGLEAEGAKLNRELATKLGLEIKPGFAELAFKEQQAWLRTEAENKSRERAAATAASARSSGGLTELRDDAMRAWTAINTNILNTLKEDRLNYGMASPEQKRAMETKLRQDALRQNPHLLTLLPELQSLQSSGPSAQIDLSKWGDPRAR